MRCSSIRAIVLAYKFHTTLLAYSRDPVPTGVCIDRHRSVILARVGSGRDRLGSCPRVEAVLVLRATTHRDREDRSSRCSVSVMNVDRRCFAASGTVRGIAVVVAPQIDVVRGSCEMEGACYFGESQYYLPT